jgi:hypothetical protein
MISRNKNQCEVASEYYCDMLNPDTMNQVPENIMVHVANCVHCVKKLAQLHESLSEATLFGQEKSFYIRQILIQLVRHFSLLDAEVDCQTVKGFLPLFVAPELEITIPTPVTVHLDQCLQCSQDFETLRSLKLDLKQLVMLADFFSQSSFQNSAECLDVSKSIKAIAQMHFEHLTADALKHICLCRDCRNLLSDERLAMSSEVAESEKSAGFPCDLVKATDLFVYCLPYGLDPTNDRYAKFRESLTGHLRNCPTCLEKMHQLNNTLYAIADRAESGVVTCYELTSSAKKAGFPDVGDPYTGWPIRVQVLDKSRPEPDIIAFPQGLKQKVSAINLRRFRIPAAAAIILIAIGLFFFGTPAAKAVDLGQIYNALARIKNVCITTFVSGESKPSQEVWISRALNIKMIKTKTKWRLWDIRAESKMARDLITGSLTTVKLDEDMLVKIEEAIKEPVGLRPFDDITEVPEDAIWQQVTDETIETTIPNTQVYDLTWTEKALDGSMAHKKWRGYIDTETKLPKRVERWIKLAKEEYKLLIVIEAF